jgi:hypothetical protein
LQKPKASNQSSVPIDHQTTEFRRKNSRAWSVKFGGNQSARGGDGWGGVGGGGADRTGGLIHPSNHGISKKEFREHEVFNLPQSKGGTQMRARWIDMTLHALKHFLWNFVFWWRFMSISPVDHQRSVSAKFDTSSVEFFLGTWFFDGAHASFLCTYRWQAELVCFLPISRLWRRPRMMRCSCK